MKALVVYDSVFGNTEKVAQTIGQALADSCQVETLPVSQVTSEKLRELDILVVGSPTRGFRPIEGITRFLNGLSKEQLDGLQVAAFDTRIWLETIDSSVFRFVVDKGGYAADTIAKSLKKKGGTLVVAPEGFLVTGEEGPLKEGELERAAAWAGKLFAG
jgi:flavodoxin